jgi:hypothetical protein
METNRLKCSTSYLTTPFLSNTKTSKPFSIEQHFFRSMLSLFYSWMDNHLFHEILEDNCIIDLFGNYKYCVEVVLCSCGLVYG